jgi:hypothetical protein
MAILDLPNTGTDLVNNAPLVSDGKAVVKAASSGDIGSLSADVGSFALSAATDVADPLNALISAGLGFLEDWCTPVKNCLAQVTGKPDELDKNKEAFTEVAKDLSKLSGELTQITASGFQNWNGDAKDAATQAIDTFVQGVDGTANNATDIASLLGISGTLMEAAKEIINGILSTLIEWLIVTWVTALATSWCTFGASDAAAAAATSVEAGVEGANAADKVEQTGSLIERIVNIIKNIIEKLKSIAKDPKGFKNEIAKNHSLLKQGKDVLPSAEKGAAKAGESAGKDAGHAASDTAASDASKAGDSAKAGDGTAPASDTGKPGFLQNKLDEAKQGLQHPLQELQETNTDARKSGNMFSNLVTNGDKGPSPLVDTFMDTGIKGGTKITGTLLDGSANQQDDGPDGWGIQSGTIDQELQG